MRDETIKKIYKKKHTLKQHSSKRNDNKLERYTKRETERDAGDNMTTKLIILNEFSLYLSVIVAHQTHHVSHHTLLHRI